MFELDWDSGEFIFCAAKSEDADGNIIPFPKDIDLKKVMKAIPDTTDTMFRGGRYNAISSSMYRRSLRPKAVYDGFRTYFSSIHRSESSIKSIPRTSW